MKIVGSILSLIFCLGCSAQNWQSVGSGLDNDVRVFYPDTAQNVLYGGGSFWSSGSSIMNGVSAWNHTQWDSLAGGTTQCASPGCTPVVAIDRYNGEIYAGGFFAGMQNVNGTSGIAKWTGSGWASVGGCNGVVFDFAQYGGDLYAVGNFDSIGGIQAFNIAKYDGTAWYAIADTIFKNNPLSSAIVYQSELYVGGAFHVTSLGLNCIARYNGILWNSVGSSFVGGCFINTMELYQSNLIVAGYFSPAMGGPAEGIAQWDGTSWTDVGGGLVDTLGFPASVFDFCIHNNKLIAGGTFCFAGGVHASNIAQWDGSMWCSFGSQFSSGITAVESFDDTLYVGGGFWSIDSDTSFKYVAQWIGGNFVDTCGNTSGVEESLNNSSVSVYPNPTSDFVTFEFSGDQQQRSLVIYDAFGRDVRHEETNESSISLPVQGFSAGVYFYAVLEKDGLYATGKFIVDR